MSVADPDQVGGRRPVDGGRSLFELALRFRIRSKCGRSLFDLVLRFRIRSKCGRSLLEGSGPICIIFSKSALNVLHGSESAPMDADPNANLG